ncbi:hypothetical protein MKEN_00618100 [Mycena kentingensis (nom. inval.)]|nr:hypothetical protein MKEN_00618100 [Mycena kentingensis (nom. inval.)]
MSEPAHPLPPLGSQCPCCNHGTILPSKQASGNNNPEHKGCFYVKCSFNYYHREGSPLSQWLTEQAVGQRCKDGFWWVEPGVYPKPQGTSRCTGAYCKGKGERNGTCTHWLCKACCIGQEAVFGAAHCCALRSHSQGFKRGPPSAVIGLSPSPADTQSDVPSPPATPSTKRISSVATPSTTPQKRTLPVFGHNLSPYARSSLPPSFVQNSLNAAKPVASAASPEFDARKTIQVAWSADAQMTKEPIYCTTAAPHLPKFMPSESQAVLRLSRLDAAELSAYSVLVQGVWSGRDVPMTVSAGQSVVFGPFEFAGMRASPGGGSQSWTPTPSPTKRSSGNPPDSPSPLPKRIKVEDDAPLQEVIVIDDSDDDQGESLPQSAAASALAPGPEHAVFPGTYTVDVHTNFSRFTLCLRDKNRTAAIKHVFGCAVPDGTFYRHYKMWQARDEVGEIKALFEDSLSAHRNPGGEWMTAVYSPGQKHLPKTKNVFS